MLSLDKLKNIDTPARYTGGEARQVIKNVSSIKNRVCVASPAMYELGMFDFDVKNIYYALNQRKDTWCERCFAPMPDFEKLLRMEDEPLYTLESKTALKDMDVIIFVLSTEMMYTNVLNMLNLGKVPILKERRKENYPLIILTGSAIINPKPLEKFADLFIVGESHLVLPYIIDKINENKGRAKELILDELKDMPGVYVPEKTLGDVYYLKELDIDRDLGPKSVVVPSIKTMIDKSLVVVSKGCDKNCVMCTNKFINGTVQEMSVDKAYLKAKRLVDATGNTEVMFMANCYADYSGFPDVIYKVQDLDKPKIKDVSFMEVKFTKDNLWLLKYMKNFDEPASIIVGAPTENLQKIIGVGMKEDDVLFVAKKAFEAGFNKIRLKYIIGGPTETYEDLSKILVTANKICKVYKEVYSKAPDKYIVNVNLYNFKAKPHTPSQWCATNTAENFEIRQRYLKDKNKNEFVIFTEENGKQSVIETMLGRGDERVSEVLYEAWKQGARHDMLEPLFSYDSWQVALNKTGVDIKWYLQELNEKKILPWDNIYVGTDKDELRRIYINNIKGD